MLHPIEFIRRLEQGDLAPVYLFIGEADLLMEEAWKRLVEKVVPAKARNFNGERWLAKEHPAAEVVTRLSNIPMFGKKQLLMVQQVEAWPKEQHNLLLSYLSRPHPTSCLVMTASKKKGTEKLQSAVEQVGAVVQFSAPSEKEAPRWLQARAQLKSKSITPRAAAFLVELVGVELNRLDSELDKLCVYVGDRAGIDVEDVREVVGVQRTYSVFELLGYVSRQESNKAVKSLRNLILSGEPPLAVLALLARQIRLCWQAKDGAAQGLTPPQLAQKMGVPPFVVKNYTQEASHFTESDLYRIHQAIRKTDLALKSTGTSPEIMLEALVLSLCLKK
jgi:DNA polymerase-3 subunit delta